MIDLLSGILCVLRNILLAVLYAGTLVVNAIITAVVAFANFLLALLPTMPAAPEATNITAVRWAAWFYPVGEVVAALSAMALLFLGYTVIRIALRWMKADA